MNDREFVVRSFNDNFLKYKDCNIVIYGLGNNTEAVLEKCKDFHIVGLMDGKRTDGEQWGKRILSKEELVEHEVKAVVILATPANVVIIYKRIREICTANGICVYDINGELIEKNEDRYRMPEFFVNVTKSELYRKIDAAEVISFDIFDTLVTRDVMHPTDVFEIVAEENRNKLPEGYDFVANRIGAERSLYAVTYPTIQGIYECMAQNYRFPAELTDYFIEKELCKERELIHAREPMIDAVNYALEQGKEVCCTSDMYISAEVLRDILKNAGYHKIEKINVSCEYGMAKYNGLFGVLKECYAGKRILHIGDNHDADIRAAQNAGIDDTFEISSGYGMMQKSPFGSIEYLTNTLSERRIMGEFIANVLNDPFLFASTLGRCSIENGYMLGYYFFEPVVHAFLLWLIQNADDEGTDILLLGSRDGWLIKELLDIYSKKHRLNFEYKYFYASRSACTLAGMACEDDFRYASTVTFDGTSEELLKKRFMFDDNEILERLPKESDTDYLMRHAGTALKHAEKYRNNYMEYTDSFKLSGKKVGLFDFVASGTCQLWLEKITGIRMTGFYFLQNYQEYKKELTVRALLKKQFAYENRSKLYRDYYFLENILTSPEPTLRYVGRGGKMVFGEDKRNIQTIECLQNIHRGIRDAFEKRTEMDDFSLEFAEEFVDLVRQKYSEMKIDYFGINALEDEFSNRSFDLKQVM